ncbi:hypothetical protein FACS189413_09460 [Bacteroidia bacterium]|nr:hypothetical protein FACS189413_09460 [Bacteroidia bacterium]
MNLNHYIRGVRKGKEINRLEKAAMNDSFLADAMSGYDKTDGNHEQQIEALRRRIYLKTKQKNVALRNWSIAASILLILGIGGMFFFQAPDFQTKEQEFACEEIQNFEFPLSNENEEKLVENKINDLRPAQKKLIAQADVVKKDRVAVQIEADAIITQDEVIEAMAVDEKQEVKIESMAQIEVSEKPCKFKDYLKREMIAPTDENGKKIKGKVKLSFSVDENGRAYDIVVVKSLAALADTEAIRLVGGFGGWEKGLKQTVSIGF